MVLRGPDTDPKDDGDFAVTFSFGHPSENLAFPSAQAQAAQRSEISIRHSLLTDAGGKKNLVIPVSERDLSSEQRQEFQLVIGKLASSSATEGDATEVSFIFQRHRHLMTNARRLEDHIIHLKLSELTLREEVGDAQRSCETSFKMWQNRVLFGNKLTHQAEALFHVLGIVWNVQRPLMLSGFLVP